MTKIDKSYLDRIGEVLYDEKKPINYKTASILNGVHVNIAKQMLYHMYKTSKADGKKIYATYYISGMVSRKMLRSIGRKDGEETFDESSSQSPADDLEAYLVSICREKDMEDIKAKYSKIFSIHIYSLSTFPIENYDALESLVEFPLRDSEGRTPVDFGPVMCSASQNLKPGGNNIRSDPKSTVSKPKNDEVKVGEVKKQGTTTGLFKSTKVSDNAEDTAKDTKTEKQAKSVTTEKKDSNRLKSMFATAATKPKPPAKKPENPKPDANKDTNGKAKVDKNETKSSSNRSKDSETRKRKRIRDVLLSSDSEEDVKMSDDEEDTQPESPVPRKRIQIESDSDDDFKESPKKQDDPPVVTEKNVGSKRKRVSKTISKSYVDKDGFLVTTKEQVMVSEDEDTGEVEKEESTKPNLNSLKNSGSESVSKKPSEQQPVKSNKPAKPVNGKTKQASLMSFFQKK